MCSTTELTSLSAAPPLRGTPRLYTHLWRVASFFLPFARFFHAIDGGGHGFESSKEELRRGREVESHALRAAEVGAVIEEDARFAEKEEVRRVNAQRRAVNPHQVRGLVRAELELRQALSDEVPSRVAVAPQRFDQLGMPRPAFAVDGLSRSIGENVERGQTVPLRLDDAFAQLGIGHGHEGEADTGHVEGFARRAQHDGALQHFLRQIQGAVVAQAFIEYQIAVNLIRAENEIMAAAELADAQKLLARPAAPERVLRVAEQKELGVGLHGALHRLPVEAPVPSLASTRNGDELAVGVFMAVEHGRIGRGADHDAGVRRGADGACNQGEGRHAAGQVVQPFGACLNAVTLAEVVDDGAAQLVRHEGVAEEGVAQAPLQRLDEAGRRLDVHIGDAEGQGALKIPLDISGVAALFVFGELDAHGYKLVQLGGGVKLISPVRKK